MNNQSRALVNRRKVRDWDSRVLAHLVWPPGRHPALGFEKLRLFLADWREPRKLACPSASTLRRLAKGDNRL